MGRYIHRTLIVTSSDQATLVLLHEKAKTLFEPNLVTPIMDSKCNGFRTFYVATSGSKDGWPEAEKHELECKALLAIVKIKRADGVLVEYGEITDEGGARIAAHAEQFSDDEERD